MNGVYVDIDQDDRLLQFEGERAHKDVGGKTVRRHTSSCCSDLGSRGVGPRASRGIDSSVGSVQGTLS